MVRSLWVRSFLVTLFGTLLLFVLDQVLNGSVWKSLYTPADTITYFCETTHLNSFIRQPANTYTNLGYLLIGALMIGFGFRDMKNREGNLIRRFPIYSFLYGAMLVYTFIGSSLFHASLALLPEWVDLSAVYAVTAVPIVYNLHRIGEAWGQSYSIWPFFLLWLCWSCLATIFTWEMKAHIVMPGMILFMLATLGVAEYKQGNSLPWKWILGMVFATGLGVLFFVADIRRVGCLPDGVLHPHGLWHLAAAAGSGCYYGYMRGK